MSPRFGGRAWQLGMAALALGLGLAPLGGAAVAAGALTVLLPLAGAAFRRVSSRAPRPLPARSAADRRGGPPASPTLGAADNRGRSLAFLAAGAAVLVLAGGLAGQARLRAIDAPGARVRDGATFAAAVVALGRPRPSPFGATVEAGVRAGPLAGARLLVRVPRWRRWPSERTGELVAVRGELRRLRAGGRGAEFAAHLRRRGVAAELMLDRARATGERRGGATGAIDRMRERSERAIEAGLPRAEAGLPRAEAELLRGMVLGEDELIPRPVRDDFRASGLAHLLAVSGQNVMLLAALALPLLALAGLGVRARCAVLLGLVAVYVPLAGAGPSLQRAGVMGAAGTVALASSRPASRTYALLLAATATLALNPRAAADPAWQLSFAAVAGIVWLTAPLQRRLREALGGERAPAAARPAAALRRRAREGLADGAAITLVATVATAPLLAFHFGTAPAAGLPANLLALPAVAPAMWLGMIDVAVGQLAAWGEPGDALGRALARVVGGLARLPVAYIAWLAERFADLPGGQLRLPLRSPPALAGAYAALLAGVAVVRRHAGRFGPPLQAALGRWRRLPRVTRSGVAAAAIGAAALAAAGGWAAPKPPRALTVRFLDVGQGDATLVQHPDGGAVLFDAGPPEAGTARLLRKAGVRRLSVVVATHASRDHHGGLAEVLSRFPVDLLLDGGDGSRDPGLRRALSEARARGVRRIAAVAPMQLSAGGLTVTVLSPPPRAPGPAPEDPNPRAVVAVVSAGGFDLLLSADAESDALAPLSLPDVEAMKVAHHGSADPGLPELLDRVRPELAAIEVGRENTYGHPAPSTLRALRAAGVAVHRTDRDGTITLTAGARGLEAETER